MSLSQSFHYKKNQLYCEGVPIEKIARKVGTPFYLYSHQAFRHQFLSLKKALSPIRPLICYAMKANSNLAVLKNLIQLGAGLDIVSGGELYRALKAGCPPKRIVFAGVGKSRDEIEQAIQVGIFSFNVESTAELEAINKIAQKLKKRVRVALRINPNVDAKTHKKITTGKAENKFGIDLTTAENLFLNTNQYPYLSLKGLHVHIGSQITQSEPFRKALTKVLTFMDRLEKQGVRIESLDLGGGLGIVYHKEKSLSPAHYAAPLNRLLRKRKLTVLFEPGRFISGNSGILVTQVHYIKKSHVKKFVITDAAMNDLMRPSIYDAYHEILPVKKARGAKRTVADVVGPVCETGDVLGYARKLPPLFSGDLLAVMSAGAYGFAMSSNYNARPRPAEVMVKGSRFKVVRKRESLSDLIRGETFL